VFCDFVKIFSREELTKFNGQDESLPVYMAIKGLVYDVTKGRDFNGKGGSYNIFAGKDCTRAVAKWSKKQEDMIPNLVSSLNSKKPIFLILF
jgi:membrane-associated progesterone receptor component